MTTLHLTPYFPYSFATVLVSVMIDSWDVTWWSSDTVFGDEGRRDGEGRRFLLCNRREGSEL